MEVIQRNSRKKSCFGCTHLEIEDVWMGAHVATCGRTDGLFIPFEWTGSRIVINGIGEFCEGKELTEPDKVAG
jgi:hypothetical protein